MRTATEETMARARVIRRPFSKYSQSRNRSLASIFFDRLARPYIASLSLLRRYLMSRCHLGHGGGLLPNVQLDALDHLRTREEAFDMAGGATWWTWLARQRAWRP